MAKGNSQALDFLILAAVAGQKGKMKVAASAFDKAMRSHDIVPTLVALDKLNSADFDVPGADQDTDNFLEFEDWNTDPDDVRDHPLDWDESMPGGKPTDAKNFPYSSTEEEDDETASLDDDEELAAFVSDALQEIAGMGDSAEYDDNELMGDYTDDGNDLTGASLREAVKANLAALKKSR